MTMRHSIYSVCIVALLAVSVTACDFFDPDPVTDPNSPSTDEVLNGANKSELQNLVTGLESRHREAPPDVTELYGSFGREVYATFASDPRFITNWLGQDGVTPDAEFFADGGAFDAPYAAIKQGNFLIEAVNNTDAVSEQERNGYIGFAKTIQAYQYLIALNGQWRGPDRSPPGSIRIDVADPLNPGPFLSYDDALAEIRSILDEANGQLGNAGSEFAFTLSEGFAGFDTPSTMQELNRAIAARAAIYAEDWSDALSALDASFLSLESGEASMNEAPTVTPPVSKNNHNGMSSDSREERKAPECAIAVPAVTIDESATTTSVRRKVRDVTGERESHRRGSGGRADVQRDDQEDPDGVNEVPVHRDRADRGVPFCGVLAEQSTHEDDSQ